MNTIPSHPVLTCAEARAWEAGLLKDEVAEWAAMQQAGTKVACSILDDFKEIGGLPKNARLLVLAGKGHNGGDALLAAKKILEKYPEATADLLLCFGEAKLRPLARRSFDELRQTTGTRCHTVTIGHLKAGPASYDLCLDGIFGFQFRPPMDEMTAEVLAWVNANPAIKFRAAVDLPSGVYEGDDRGEPAFKADFTYATGILKQAAIEPMNTDVLGRVRYLDLGFFSRQEPEAKLRVLLSPIIEPLGRLRPAQTDKRTYGHLFVVGGSRNYPGAVFMTVQAALRSGVGLLTAFVPASLVPEYAARFPEAMWVGWPETADGGLALPGIKFLLEKLPRATALAIGPGLGSGPETIALVKKIVDSAQVPLLLDADALRPEVMASIHGKPVILTPHAGEFRRIMSEPGWRDGAVLVLKGSPTQISDAKAVYFSLFGGPVLARGGSGDILAGLIGGLLAQAPADLLLAACRGVVWHGLAADLLARDKGQVAVQTTQLFDHLQPALLPAAYETT